MSDDNVVTFTGENNPSNVVTFKGNTSGDTGANAPMVDQNGKPLVFTCSNCGCRSWRLMSDSTIECCNCDMPVTISEDDPVQSGWRRVAASAPSDPSTVPELEDGNVNVRSMSDVDFARNSTFRDIEKWRKNNELVFVGAYKDDGGGIWWIGANDGEGRDWIVGKIQAIADHMKATKYPDQGEGDEGKAAQAPDGDKSAEGMGETGRDPAGDGGAS